MTDDRLPGTDPVGALTGVAVLVIGDGTVERISPEAPTPILAWAGERQVAGGSANVAANIAALEHFYVSLNRRNALVPCFVAFSSREPVATSLENALEHFYVSLNRRNALVPCFVAFSSREPVATSLENALGLIFR